MAETAKGGARLEASAPSRHKIWKLILGMVLVLLAAGYGALCAVAYSSDTIFPNTAVLGNPVGGLTQAEAAERLEPLLPEGYRSHGISFRIDGEDALLTSLAELGLSPDAEESARLAYAAGRGGNVLQNGYYYGRALLLGQEITPPLDLSDSAIDSAADTVLAAFDREAQPVRCRLDENDPDHVYFIQAQTGRRVDGERLHSDLSAMLAGGSLGSIELSYETLPFDESVTVRTLAKELLNERRNAWYDPATEEISEAVVGVEFNVNEAEQLLQAAAEGEEIAVAGAVAFPAVYKAELEQVLFRDILASYTTKVTGTAARVGNVRLAAKACSGAVLNSGDVFSFNKRVGKRTEARGYRPATAYVAGESVDTIGGGICQASSTLYAACLYADLEITNRTAHRYVSSYIPYGLDATVSWGTLDYCFRNNTDYPIRVVSHYENGKLTFLLYGTKTDDHYVKMTSKQLGDAVGWETVYQESPDLPAGTEEVKQTPYTGRKIQTYRNVYAGDGTLLSSEKEALSDYKSRDKIILVGTAGTVTPPGGGGVLSPDDTGAEAPEIGDVPIGGGTPTGDDEIVDWGD